MPTSAHLEAARKNRDDQSWGLSLSNQIRVSEANEPAAKSVSRAELRVLALDDQDEVLTALRRLLGRRGFSVIPFTDPSAALDAIAADESRFDLAIFDVNMPQMNGLEVLSRAKDIAPDLPIVMLTADDSAATAVSALKLGAFNYLVKPLDDADAVAMVLMRAGEVCQLQRRAKDLERRVTVNERFETLVGATTAMRDVFATIERVAASDANVLVQGESGTGKELAARAIHNRSGRKRAPFVALNCAAIPENLIDSELFGHAKGAFTGAIGTRPGVFVEADGGTLFLDEIGDIPMPVQLRLLRVLQEREVRPVGGTGSRPIDVRVIAATHVDLDHAVRDKRFRMDLYYRLNVVGLALPPLRDRSDDVPLLTAHLLEKHAARLSRAVPSLANDTMAALVSYSWPGNVRELENAIQRALAMSTGTTIPLSALPPRVLESGTSRPATSNPMTTIASEDDLAWVDGLSFGDARRQVHEHFERAYLRRLLQKTMGNISEAARLAGLDRSNFRRVLVRNAIDPSEFRPA